MAEYKKLEHSFFVSKDDLSYLPSSKVSVVLILAINFVRVFFLPLWFINNIRMIARRKKFTTNTVDTKTVFTTELTIEYDYMVTLLKF